MEDGSMSQFISQEYEECLKQEEQGIYICILDRMGRVRADTEDADYGILAFEDILEEGDQIHLKVPEANCWYVVRIDDTMDEALVYLTEKEWSFEIPFEEKKKSYNKKSFTGQRHYMTCRKAEKYEWKAYRNLAKNVMDQHENHGCYPHASANVETRGESVFAAQNAIDGVVANRSHGSWPYASWGINQREDAEFLLEFGIPVDLDRIVLWTRADFPHDNWWKQATLEFSDGSSEVILMEKQEKPHRFSIKRKGIIWMKLKEMKKSEEPSPFPALTQIEVYGIPRPGVL